MNRVTIHQGNILEIVPTMPDKSVHCIVTSPPYWILRNYEIEPTSWPAVEFVPAVGLPPVQIPSWRGCFGMEPDPWAFVGHMVLIFRELRRVLRDDGTLWLNLADCYAGAGGSGGDYSPRGCRAGQRKYPGRRVPGLPAKNLVGIPSRVILALQADGWIWRSDIIWNKSNVRPAPFKDRPTVCHENIFLLSKKGSYFYDAEAIKEEVTGNTHHKGSKLSGGKKEINGPGFDNWTATTGTLVGRKASRTVWNILTAKYKDAHYATFPEDLPARCIKAGTSEEGCCPSCGTPWIRITEQFENGQLQKAPDSWEDGKGRHGDFHAGGRQKGAVNKPVLETRTIGWDPGCKCLDESKEYPRLHLLPVPCTVLDPFGGAMTTPLVAAKLGRDAVACELSTSYVTLGEKRLKDGLGMLVKITSHNPPPNTP